MPPRRRCRRVDAVSGDNDGDVGERETLAGWGKQAAKTCIRGLHLPVKHVAHPVVRVPTCAAWVCSNVGAARRVD